MPSRPGAVCGANPFASSGLGRWQRRSLLYRLETAQGYERLTNDTPSAEEDEH